MKKKDKKYMFFSERYGYKKIDEKLLIRSMPEYLRNRIWNVFSNMIFRNMDERPRLESFIVPLWSRFFKRDLDEIIVRLKIDTPSIVVEIKNWFYNAKWYEIYDFIEFFILEYTNERLAKLIAKVLNEIFEEERVSYKIIDGIVTPITNKEEIKEIEKALNPPDKFAGVREHLKKALEKFSNRKKPDYQNSIKECMSALDSLASAIKGKKTTYTKFVKELNIHKALKKGFESLYSWSSDEKGIRHGITGEKLEPLPAEARYILITVSAFANYVIGKYFENRTGEDE